MPIYEYDCSNCNRRFEVYQLVIGPHKEHLCTVCGGGAILAVSVPAMQPDDMWMGKYDEALGRTFDSKKRRDDYCKARGIETSDSGAGSAAADARGRQKAAERKALENEVGELVRDIMI